MSGPRQHITPSFYLSQFCGSSPEGRFKDTKHGWRMHGGPKKTAEVRVRR